MFTIGDFARHGRVSVRILRHYDALGLLHPARVDASTGYRYYTAGQLSRLNRIIALKDLGLSLTQVGSVLDGGLDAEQLRGMLRLRRAELAEQIAADSARLARVAARLTIIESEGRMPEQEIVVKSLPSVRLAELTDTAAGYDVVGPVIQPLYPRLLAALRRAGVTPTGPGMAYYTEAANGGVLVHAGITVSVTADDAYEFAVVDLPAVPSAATTIHHGPMDTIGVAWQALGRWADGNGYRTLDGARELYLEGAGDNQNAWVTELHQPVTTA